MRFMSTVGVAVLAGLMGCATPGNVPTNPDDNTGVIPDGKADGARTNGTPRQRFDRLVNILKGGPDQLDMPQIARDYELPFVDAVHVEVTTVAAPDGLGPIVAPVISRMIEEFSSETSESVTVLENAGDTHYALQNFGARDYFLKTLIDRRARAEVTDLLGDADEVFRFGIYDNGSELTGDEYIAIYFRDLDKAIIFDMGYSEVY